MSFLTLLALGFGLSVDSFAAAMARGSAITRLRRRDAWIIGLIFGLTQALMPLVGWLAGRLIAGWVEVVDHWIAFGLLAAIGGQMIVRASIALRAPEAKVAPTAPPRLGGLIMTALATSIDAVAIGVGLAMTTVNIWAACLIIGVVTTVMAAAGVFIGRKAGQALGPWAELLGGLVLVVLGASILGEHLSAM